MVVWQLADGKRGHERQVEGLVAALAERVSVDLHRFDVAGTVGLLGAATGRFAPGTGRPAPDLVVAAGRRSHWPAIAARRARGGLGICLMRPALPLSAFDLCVIPAHDEVSGANVIVTEGPLNPMRPAGRRDALSGLVLVGGPSRHHGFDAAALVDDIARLVERAPAMNWIVSDSRRTPPAFRDALAAAGLGDRLRPFEDCPPGWLEGALATAARAAVTADSVAMLYETLSAGAELTVLPAPVRRHDRISRIAASLVDRGWAGTPAAAPAAPPPPLNEAARVAEAILARWPALTTPGELPP
ncbi:MAG: mitochondrial fission ELM1 family protein [Gammaproteobacteria bacterium]